MEDTSNNNLLIIGWHKGILMINGKVVGRYWPVAGPQVNITKKYQIVCIKEDNFDPLTSVQFQWFMWVLNKGDNWHTQKQYIQRQNITLLQQY